MRKPKGIVLWKGQSVLNGEPIVFIATLKTTNRKTGDMVQTWILKENEKPSDNAKNANDVAICGVCPQRQGIGGSCYVNVGQAPNAIWKSYKNDIYPELSLENSKYLKDKAIRLGAYGDPAAVPFEILDLLVGLSSMHTGYTHQMNHKNFDKRVATVCMVSTETPKQSIIATDLGYKTFRLKTEDGPRFTNEVECLADSLGISCIECAMCDGQQSSVVIDVHGTLKNRYIKNYSKINSVEV